MYTDFLVDEPTAYQGQRGPAGGQVPFGSIPGVHPEMDLGAIPGLESSWNDFSALYGGPSGYYDFSAYTQGSPSLMVSQYLRRPDLLYRRMTDISEKGFIVDALLQGGYDVQGGVIPYTRSESIYLERDPEVIPEGGPYPIAGDVAPPVLQEMAKKHGLKVFITEEMVRRNQFPQVEIKMRKLTNTIIRYVDGLFMTKLLADPDIQSRAAAAAWTASATTIVADIENAKADIRNQFEGYEPDTLIINPGRLPALTVNAEIRQAYVGSAALRNPIFTGQLPPLFGLDLMYTPNIPAGTGLVMMRDMIGGRGDEVPMEVRSLPFDEHYDRFWLKGRRVMATFLQEPKAIVKITGL